MLHSRRVAPIVLRCAFYRAASGIEPAKEWLEGSTMIILHGFQKKTQQTPAGELRLARQRQKDEP